jgi:hypothetical protein
VLERQRLAVHRDGQHRVPAVGDDGGRRAAGPAVDRPAEQLVGAGPDAGLLQQRAEQDAGPAGVADVRSADLVRDAGQRDVPLDQGIASRSA